MSNKKSSKKTKGSVGFLYNGTIKIGNAFMYYSDLVDPGDEIQKYLKYYGSNVQSRYIKCENPKEIYESILEKLKDEDNILFDSLVSCHTSSLITIFKEVAQVNQAHKFKKKVVEEEEDEEDEDEDEDEEEDEEEEVVKPSKKANKKVEENKVEKKKVEKKKVLKKSKGPAKKSKDESDEELSEEDDSSDEESEVEEVKEVKVEKKKNTKETKVKGKK